MTYTWEQESIQKYGEQVTLDLIAQQERYEMKKQDNDCICCGINNRGAVVESDNGKPFILHYGSFSYSNGKHRCHECGKSNK